MTGWERIDEQTGRVLALDADERLYALLWLRYDHPDALDVALAKAEAFKADRAAGRRP